MRWVVMVLLMALCILTLICYALCVMAHDADERAEQFYKEWKEKDDDQNIQSTDE